MSSITIGSAAPAFALTSHEGTHVTLESLKGRNIVLYFYPKDDTPGCTTEAKDFTALASEFDKANTTVIGVSRDNVDSHCKFISKYDLKLMLLSDEDGKACAAYGVWVEKSMYGKKYMGIERTTFLIDAEGILRQVWPKVKVKDHAAEVLAAAQGL